MISLGAGAGQTRQFAAYPQPIGSVTEVSGIDRISIEVFNGTKSHAPELLDHFRRLEEALKGFPGRSHPPAQRVEHHPAQKIQGRAGDCVVECDSALPPKGRRSLAR